MNSLTEEQEYDGDSVVHLSLDTPDPLLLSSCKDAVELASMHCMVSITPRTKTSTSKLIKHCYVKSFAIEYKTKHVSDV